MFLELPFLNDVELCFDGDVMKPIMSYVFFIVQGFFIILIGATGRLVSGNPFLLGGAVIGVFIMIWAVWTMRLNYLNMLPDTKRNSGLVTSGPYKVIRHPMYTAVLLFTLMLVLNDFTLLRAIFWLVLAVDLYFKLRYEESLLLENYPEYSAYKARTKRLVPFVY